MLVKLAPCLYWQWRIPRRWITTESDKSKTTYISQILRACVSYNTIANHTQKRASSLRCGLYISMYYIQSLVHFQYIIMVNIRYLFFNNTKHSTCIWCILYISIIIPHQLVGTETKTTFTDCPRLENKPFVNGNIKALKTFESPKPTASSTSY